MTAVSGIQPVIAWPARYAALLMLVAVSMQPAFGLGVYRSPRIEGTIINATTKAPIADVIVTASWIQAGDTGHGEYTVKVSETETNAKGEYTLPSWGPKFYAGTLWRDQPIIRFFKVGYVPLIIHNNTAYHPGLESDTEHMTRVPETLSDGSTIYRLYEPEEHQVKFGKKRHTFMLVPFEGTNAEYVQLLVKPVGYIDSLHVFFSGAKCEWKELPVTLSALHKLKARLDAKNVNTNIGIGLPYVSFFGGQDRCGNAEEVFKEYLK